MKKNLTGFLLLLFLIQGALHGQISGTVTISSSNTATTANFKNWYSFWRNLQGLSRSDGGPSTGAGVSGPVTVSVTSDLLESQTIDFASISGASSTNTITINGNNKVVEYSGNYEIMRFSGADYLKIQNLTIRHSGSRASRSTCVRFFNGSDYNSIISCTLEFSGLNSIATDGSAYIAFSAFDTLFQKSSSTLTGRYNRISGNLMRTTNTGSAGPAFGIALCGSSSGYTSNEHNNTISYNTIQNFYFTAVSMINGNGNQLIGNAISRANSTSRNCNPVLYGIVLRENHGTSRSTRLGANTIQNIPFSGASASNGVDEFYAISALGNYGSSSRSLLVDSNTIKNIAAYTRFQAGNFRSTDYAQILNNSVSAIETYANSNYEYVWEFRVGKEMEFNSNLLFNSYLATLSFHFLFSDSVISPSGKMVQIRANQIYKNKFYQDAYVIIPNQGSFHIADNKIFENIISGNISGYLFAIVAQEAEDIIVSNNVISNNLGHDGFVGIYLTGIVTGSYYSKVWQNSIYSDGGKAPSSNYDNNGIFIENFYHNHIEMVGNVLHMSNSYTGMISGVENTDTAHIKIWDVNTNYVDNYVDPYWATPLGWLNDYASFLGLGLTGPGENGVNPLLFDPSTNDLRSFKWETQNDVTTASFNKKDITGKDRNAVLSDRGAYEQFTDLAAVKTSFSIGTNTCSGYKTTVDVTVKNNFSDTARKFAVGFKADGVSYLENYNSYIRSGDSVKISIKTPLSLDKWGTSNIRIFVSKVDDNASNDSLKFSTKIIPAPGGSAFTPIKGTSKAIYTTGAQDVTILGEKLDYTLQAPRKYTNAQYGTQWTAAAWTKTTPGNRVISGTSLTTPSGSNNLRVAFITYDNGLEDSFVSVCVRFTDLVTGCDTVNCRKSYMQPTPVVLFTSPGLAPGKDTLLICGNDTAYFTNQSTIKKGGMRYHWNFGTGKSADTSDQADVFFNYAAPGIYKVTLTAWSIPYGFESSDFIYVKVQAKPKAAFTRTNVCEGESNVFTNNSTPSSASYLWDFGDGTTSSSKDPKHTYSAPGNFTAKLAVNVSGCRDSLSSKVSLFAKPKPNFSTQASFGCTNNKLGFTNTSSISAGTFGSYWDFRDGGFSSTFEPEYSYAVAKTYAVKLRLVSNFGCKDSIVKNVSIRESPNVQFNHSALCSIDSTVFTNLTPTVFGTSPTYLWDFGDGKSSSLENPFHHWSALGKTSVILKVSLTNGCSDTVQKLLEVLPQANPGFIDNSPVCIGTLVNFSNKSTWLTGTISYAWDFGDANASTQSDPSHVFNTNITKTYTVTLCTDINNACRKCYQKPVTVNEIPQTCDFVANTDYSFGFHGIQCIPKYKSGQFGNQTGVTYKWVFQNSAQLTMDTGRFDFPTDGTYNVTMCAAFSSTSCVCCTTKTVTINRQGIIQPNDAAFTVYPNPSAGWITIEQHKLIEGAFVTIHSSTGQIAWKQSITEIKQGIDVSALAAGIYTISIHSGQGVQREQLIIEPLR
jgi:PKD repeat protein